MKYWITFVDDREKMHIVDLLTKATTTALAKYLARVGASQIAAYSDREGKIYPVTKEGDGALDKLGAKNAQ